MSTSKILISLFNYKSWANEEIFAALKNLNQVDHKNELHSAIRILNHIYVVDRIFNANLQGIKHGFTSTNTVETPSLENLWKDVHETDSWYIKYVSELDQNQLQDDLSFTFVDSDTGKMSREEMLFHLITHGGYHRGAVGRILAQLSIAPPRDVFTKFLHDTEPTRRI
ncbi:DinB family protein [Solimicrobium silvestre]|uniref:DinB family n=1 Tax=Solimicrobium silvestre TaxID=2099400 RepID=A0A2S9GV14_9BURK|nr:DinB family protein [Solimicrobium silvestre]PRC91496.1 DinB family [Solimicrobium silvestre]